MRKIIEWWDNLNPDTQYILESIPMFFILTSIFTIYTLWGLNLWLIAFVIFSATATEEIFLFLCCEFFT